MNTTSYIKEVMSGVIEIALERDHKVLGNGTGFLVEGGLITNSHVIRPKGDIDAFKLRFPEGGNEIRLLPDDFYAMVASEDPENSKDYAYIQIDEPELTDRHRFELGSINEVDLGHDLLFLGYPFGMPQLTVHRGFVSSIYQKNGINIIQIDGSVNGGNSGGPLIDLISKNVVGVVTRARKGFVEQEFDNLIQILAKNQEILSNSKAVMRVGGVDPIDGLRASMAAMQQIAQNLKRSANVGIGYAFAIDPVKETMHGVV